MAGHARYMEVQELVAGDLQETELLAPLPAEETLSQVAGLVAAVADLAVQEGLVAVAVVNGAAGQVVVVVVVILVEEVVHIMETVVVVVPIMEEQAPAILLGCRQVME